jgi:SOS response regulatory protein OraA/RecX
MAPPDAVDVAVRALARRDRCEADLRRILERKDVDAPEIERALDLLRRTGAVDDARFATRSADALARRGLGDEAIALRLEREGVSRELAAEAVATLEPESDRAKGLVERRGRGAKAARWLVGRGFAFESVERALGGIAERDLPELG